MASTTGTIHTEAANTTATASEPAVSTLNDPPPVIEDVVPPAPSLRPSVSWKSVRSRLSVSEKTSAQLGWAVAFLSVLITIVTLAPTFRSQSATEKAFELAEWTALKDYIDECREELAAGIQRQACLRAMNAKLPPPPYVKAGVLDRMRRGLLNEHQQRNATWRNAQDATSDLYISVLLQGLILLTFVVFACIFLFLSFKRTRSRLYKPSYRTHVDGTKEEAFSSPSTPQPEFERTTSIIRHPPPSPEATLRRRRDIRTHPIYRHANLEEAIHHEDMTEIRTRFQNGEDVNEHWPYLIYRLAITPKSATSPKKLEVARLCLDFGADVNALKGWNGQSALMIAIHFGNVDVAKLLIANGAMVGYSPPESNLTALHRCVRLAITGSAIDALDVMNLLFKHGAAANQSDRLGETPLHKLLIDAWFSRDDESVMKKLYPVALCLVKHGASIPATIKKKYTVGNPLWNVVHTAVGLKE